MALSGGMACVKYLVLIFNFLFWLSGLGLIVVGALVQIKMGTISTFTGNMLNTAPLVIIGVGVVIFIVSFFGCCGAKRESYCMMTTFAVILFIIFIIELASGIAAYVLKDKIHKQLIEEAHTVIKDYPKDKKAVDDLQEKLQCCGAENYTDWFGNTKWANSTAPNTSVPDSCCKLDPATKIPPHDCGKKISKDTIYMEGCVKKVENIIKKNVLIIGGVAIGIGFAQIIGILFACLLMKGIKHDYEVM